MPVETVISLPMALALGLAYGMGPCLVSCLPYLGPVFLGRDFDLRRSWQVVLPLAAGRLTGYAALGLAAGFAGQVVKDGVAAPAIRLLVGIAAVMVGIALQWRRPSCRPATAGAAPLRRMDFAEPRALLPGGLYLMGVSMALTPCAPLGVVLFTAASWGSAGLGAAFGLVFGLGAIVVPSLAYGLGAAYFGARLRAQLGNWRPALERAAAGLLVLSGVGNILAGR